MLKGGTSRYRQFMRLQEKSSESRSRIQSRVRPKGQSGWYLPALLSQANHSSSAPQCLFLSLSATSPCAWMVGTPRCSEALCPPPPQMGKWKAAVSLISHKLSSLMFTFILMRGRVIAISTNEKNLPVRDHPAPLPPLTVYTPSSVPLLPP